MGMAESLAPTMCLAFATTHYQALYEVEAPIESLRLGLVVGIARHVVYVLAFIIGSLAPEKMHARMAFVA